jgi:glycosyltransferase involved in cell wall biosynthesis
MSARVSVIVPTCNRRESLAAALASVDAQGLQPIEVLVVDDASDDAIASWIRPKHPRVHVLRLDRSAGAAAARNRGIALARGDIIAFLDDDDRWQPSFLEAQVAQLAANPVADIGTTGHVEVDPSGRIHRPDPRPVFAYSEPLTRLLAECPIHTMSVVACRRRAFDRVGAFDSSFEVAHDLDWYVRVVASGGRHVHCPAALVERGIPGGLVLRHRRWFAEENAILQRAFATSPAAFRERRRIVASRALLFASIGIAAGHFGFGIARLAQAFATAPLDAARIAATKAVRRLRPVPRTPGAGWDATPSESR